MNATMELRRTHWIAAFKLAAIVSAIAAAVALALNAFGDIPQTAVVIGVIVVGFVVSWIQSGRTPRALRDDENARHGVLAGRDGHRSAPYGTAHDRAGRGDHASHRVATVRLHHSRH